MITTNHLEDVSLELCKMEELLIALELVSDSLERGETDHAKKAHDATIGVLRALTYQHVALRTSLDELFPIAREAEKMAKAA